MRGSIYNCRMNARSVADRTDHPNVRELASVVADVALILGNAMDRLDALESPTRPLAPPADAEQIAVNWPTWEQVEAEMVKATETVGRSFVWTPTMIYDVIRKMVDADRLAPPKCNCDQPAGSGAHRSSCPAARDRDGLAPPARVRMCPRCGKHPAGGSNLCDACRPGVMGAVAAEPPLRQETGRTDYGGPQIDRPEPATVKEPLTVEDGERVDAASKVVSDLYCFTATGELSKWPGPPEVHTALLAFARAAPTARATILPDSKPSRALGINDTVPEVYQTGRADGWNEARIEFARLNPPATAGGSKNKGATA